MCSDCLYISFGESNFGEYINTTKYERSMSAGLIS